jgi:hypothetical protein
MVNIQAWTLAHQAAVLAGVLVARARQGRLLAPVWPIVGLSPTTESRRCIRMVPHVGVPTGRGAEATPTTELCALPAYEHLRLTTVQTGEGFCRFPQVWVSRTRSDLREAGALLRRTRDMSSGNPATHTGAKLACTAPALDCMCRQRKQGATRLAGAALLLSLPDAVADDRAESSRAALCLRHLDGKRCPAYLTGARLAVVQTSAGADLRAILAGGATGRHVERLLAGWAETRLTFARPHARTRAGTPPGDGTAQRRRRHVELRATVFTDAVALRTALRGRLTLHPNLHSGATPRAVHSGAEALWCPIIHQLAC